MTTSLQLVEPQDHWLNTLATWLFRKWMKWRIAFISPIDVNARCPGCGHCKGEIKFMSEVGHIVHRCLVCDANWSEQPIVRAEGWALNLEKVDDE